MKDISETHITSLMDIHLGLVWTFPQTQECLICMEGVKHMKVFICKHSICSSCTEKIYSPECPLCRGDISDSFTDEELHEMEKRKTKMIRERREEEYHDLLRQNGHILPSNPVIIPRLEMMIQSSRVVNIIHDEVGYDKVVIRLRSLHINTIRLLVDKQLIKDITNIFSFSTFEKHVEPRKPGIHKTVLTIFLSERDRQRHDL